MMGYSHTVSAAAAWLALNEAGVLKIEDPLTLAVTTLVAAGAGMLPDIDHPRGSIAHSLPPLSRWLTRLVASVSGGHRQGTHSLLGLAFFWALTLGSLSLTYAGFPLLALALAAFSGGLALRVLGAPGGWLGAALVLAGTWFSGALTFLPWAVVCGATVHLIGDALTTRGVNLLWPLRLKPLVASRFWRKSGFMALPILGDAGSGREKLLTGLLTVYVCAYAAAFFGLLPFFPHQLFSAWAPFLA